MNQVGLFDSNLGDGIGELNGLIPWVKFNRNIDEVGPALRFDGGDLFKESDFLLVGI